MIKETYFIRVLLPDLEAFEEYIKCNHLSGECMSIDISNGISSRLFSMKLTTEEELAVRLTFKLKGCMNFKRTMSKLVAS